jgi:hypothetical protein
MSDIRPGLRIEFFYSSDYEKEDIHVMRSLVYDVTDTRLVVAPPSPTIPRSKAEKYIIVTYMARQEGRPVRFGFHARIMDLSHSYQISSGEMVPAIIIQQESAPEEFNIRFHFRLRVPSISELRLFIKGKRSTLIDISIGGAMISGETVRGFREHDRTRISVHIDTKVYDLDAEVLRIWSPAGGRRNDLQLAALRFINPPRLFESALGKAIFSMERQLLAREVKKGYR